MRNMSEFFQGGTGGELTAERPIGGRPGRVGFHRFLVGGGGF